MDLTLILGLIKIGLEVFQEQTKDKYLKQYLKIQSEYQDEINKGIDNWSDLKLSQLRFDAKQLGELIIKERSNKST